MSGELSEVGVQRFKGVSDSQRLYGVRRARSPRASVMKHPGATAHSTLAPRLVSRA